MKLMTVHSAKGLEFECVFVPSRRGDRGQERQGLLDLPEHAGVQPADVLCGAAVRGA